MSSARGVAWLRRGEPTCRVLLRRRVGRVETRGQARGGKHFRPRGKAGAGSGGTSTPASTGLGTQVDGLVNKSPSLAKDVQTLTSKGWSISYGAPGGGSYTVASTKRIVIDGNRQSNSSDAARSVSHEVGHALHPNTHVGSSGLTRAEYVKKNTNADLAGEGAATLSNARARAEIKRTVAPTSASPEPNP